MKKIFNNIYWFFSDMHDAFIVNVYYFYRAKRNRNCMVCIFRGMKTQAQVKEYMKAIEEMEKHLSFPIINKH